jgi:ankyrin repeat protein
MGFTALDKEASPGYTQVVEQLLKHGASPNAVAPNKFAPLYIAAHFNQPHAMALLLQAGAAPAALSPRGSLPLLQQQSGAICRW